MPVSNPTGGTLPPEVVEYLLPSGGDDTAAINAAQAIGKELGPGTFLISGIVSGEIRGQAEKTTIRATAAAAGAEHGPALPAAPLNTGANPRAGGYVFDANNLATGGAKNCVVHTNCVDWTFGPIQVVNAPVGVDALSICGQNNRYELLNVGVPQQSGARFALFFDNGAGGNTLSSVHTNGHAIDYRETVGTHGYVVPQANVIERWVADTVTVTSADYCVRHTAGAYNVIQNIEAVTWAPALIKFEDNPTGYHGGGFACGRLVLQGKCGWAGQGPGHGQYWVWADYSSNGTAAAAGMGGDVAMVITGHQVVSGIDGEFKWGTVTPVIGAHPEVNRTGANVGTRPLWTPSGTGALLDANGTWRVNGKTGINGLPDATLAQDVQFKDAGAGVAGLLVGSSQILAAHLLDMQGHKIQGLADPQADGDSTSRGYARAYAHKTAWAPVNGATENYSRLGRKLNSGLILTSGRLCLTGGFVLQSGRTASHITFYGANTQMVGGTHCWFCLYNSAGALIGVTNEDTTAAPITKGAGKTLDLAAPYTAVGDTALYAGIVVVATTTMPDLLAADAPVGSTIYSDGIVICGFYQTGLTTPATAPANVGNLAGQIMHPYAYLT